MNRFKGQRGLSLVEVTIMLLVLMLLTGVLAPSIFDFVNDAKWVKVKEDCEAIGISVARLHRDVGCIRFNGTGPCSMQNRVDILYSDGPDVTAADQVDAGNVTYVGAVGNMQHNGLWWLDDQLGDRLEDQLATNVSLYNPASSYQALNGNYPAGPFFGIGWRGAYLSTPIGPDPWGHRYLVNSIFMNPATDATQPAEGNRSAGFDRDTFCISAGPNALYETFFGGSTTGFGTDRRGDDFVFVISGGTR